VNFGDGLRSYFNFMKQNCCIDKCRKKRRLPWLNRKNSYSNKKVPLNMTCNLKAFEEASSKVGVAVLDLN